MAGMSEKASSWLEEGRARLGKAGKRAAEYTYSLYAKAEIAVGSAVGRVSRATQQLLGSLAAARAAARLKLQRSAASVFGVVETWQELGENAYADVKERGLRTCALEAADSARQVAGETVTSAHAAAKARAEDARLRAGAAAQSAASKAKEIRAVTGEVAARPDVQVTAASALAGSATLGTAGAATGAVAGAVAGGAAGLPLALFTFGLSIPLGAALGGGAGLVAGAGGGAALGLAAGGAVGYGAYSKKDDIRGAGESAWGKAGEGAEYVKGQALTTVGYARDAFGAARARLTGRGRAGTGGTVGDMD